MKGEDFIALAGNLAVTEQAGEAIYRTSVSRSYYGAFHVARALFQSLGLKLSRDHGDYQRCLIEAGDPQSTILGRHLNELHGYRIRADYELSDRRAGSARHARECAELAADFSLVVERMT